VHDVKAGVTAFQDMLRAAQYDPEKRNVEQATLIVAEAIRPNVLAKLQEDNISEAWRAMEQSNAPLSKRVEGFQAALEWHEKALAEHAEIAAQDKRMAAACVAFRKVIANGCRYSRGWAGCRPVLPIRPEAPGRTGDAPEHADRRQHHRTTGVHQVGMDGDWCGDGCLE
jgi:hypothetical protein